MKRTNLMGMTPDEIVMHKRELQRLKTLRLKESRDRKRREKLANMTPEEYREYRACINSKRVADSRAKGVQPRRQKQSKEETLAYKVEWARNKRQRLRIELVARYGGRCACCGVTDYRWLSLHHKNGDGGKERKELTGGKRLHAQKRLGILSAQPRRDDLELLCYNCHLAREFFGVCPHRDPTSAYFVSDPA